MKKEPFFSGVFKEGIFWNLHFPDGKSFWIVLRSKEAGLFEVYEE